jgi:non-ribosomal peptide synthetase component E (peptide arylation enzyme)
MDVACFLDISEARFPQKTAIISKERRYTYKRLKERVQCLMTGLARLGVKELTIERPKNFRLADEYCNES